MINDILNELTLSQLDAMAAHTATLTGAAFDTQQYVGEIVFVLQSGLGTGNADNTLNAKLQHCATSGGSYTDVPGAAFPQVSTAAAYLPIAVDKRALHRFVKFDDVIAGTTPSFVFGTSVIGRKQVQP